MTINIRVALSSNLLSQGISRLARECENIAVCATAYASHPTLEPDIVLIDAKQNIVDLMVKHPKARFILIDTGLKDLDLAYLLLCHHISGVIPPDADLKMFCKALNVVYGGELWIDQQYIKILINKGQFLPDGEGMKGLSVQDKRIVALVCEGEKNSEIAEALCLSETTIKAHISRIFRVLKVKNRAQLVSLARDNAMHES